MTKEKRELVDVVKTLRVDQRKTWATVAKEVSKAGYIKPTGKPYGPGTLCKMLLDEYPEARVVASYEKKTSRTGEESAAMKAIKIIMVNKGMSEREKIAVIQSLTK